MCYIFFQFQIWHTHKLAIKYFTLKIKEIFQMSKEYYILIGNFHTKQKLRYFGKEEQVRPNDVWTCVACSYFIYKKIDIKNFYCKLNYEYSLSSKGLTPTKMRRSKLPVNMHNTIWCSIYIPSFMINGSVVSEELQWKGHL